MDEFLKTIKDNLENRPEPALNPKALQDFKEKMIQQQSGKSKSKKIRGWWIWLGLLLALLSSNVFYFFKSEDLSRQLSKVELHVDTLTQTKTIYQIDTVYSTRIIREADFLANNNTESSKDLFTQIKPRSIHPFFSNDLSSLTTIGAFEQLFNADESNHLNQYLKRVQELPLLTSSSLSLNYFNESTVTPNELFAYPLDSINGLPLQAVSTEMRHARLFHLTENHPLVTPKRKINPIRLVSPKGFRLGLTVSNAKPIENNVQEQNTYALGMRMLVEFHTPIRLQLEASYLDLRYKSDEMGEAFGVPEIPSPSNDFVFHDAAVFQSALQYTLGLQYIFRPNQNWKPFVGIGYSALSLLHSEIKYNFESDQPLIDEIVIPLEIDRERGLNNLLNLNVGLEFRLSDHFQWQLEGYYRSGGKNMTLVPKLLGLKTAVLYRF